MSKRVNNGPGDNPDEYWFECDDCEGTGKVSILVTANESVHELLRCPGCDGLGSIEGDADDV
jgi:DnaJ-class molecular chaperone